MFEILVLWLFMLAACVLVGEASCRLAGLNPWSWLSGAVGLSILLVVGGAGASLPGRSTTAFVLIVVLVLASAGWITWSDRGHLRELARRAPDPAMLALLVLGATLIPFLANDRVGLLGPSFNNDSRFHMWAAEELLAGQPVPETVLGGGYPLGPHGLVAALSSGLGAGVEIGFGALLMIVVVLTAFTARAVLDDLRRPAALLAALLTSLAYLLASYYAQAAFKETMLALFVLATAATVRELIAAGRIGPRAAPLPALLLAGTLLTYSYPGLAWIAGTLGLAAVALLALNHRVLRRDAILPTIRRALPSLGVVIAVLLVALAPQANRILDFFNQLATSPSGNGVIPMENIGNLIHELSPYEGLGIWLREDFRFGPPSAFYGGALVALALGVVLYGVIWWLRRREVVVLSAAVASVLLYLFVRHGESAYLAAKALVVVSPFPVLLGARALLAHTPRLIAELRVVRFAAAVVFVCGVGWSSFLALRNAQVDPGVHQQELVSLRPLLADRDVLFLGFDDYIGWRLFGARVTDPPVQEALPFALRKQFNGASLDFDSVTTRTLDRYDFVVTTRTAYASAPPSNFVRVRQTRSYDVYRRVGLTPSNALLREGSGPGAILDCAGNAADRRLSNSGGMALVRPKPVRIQAPPGTGAGVAVRALPLKLPSAGRWELSMQYASPQVLTVSDATGTSRWRLVPNLDRLGPYWRVGELTTMGKQTLNLELRLHRPAAQIFTADSQYAPFGKIAAVRTDVAPRWVPLRRACGRYVDRYRR